MNFAAALSGFQVQCIMPWPCHQHITCVSKPCSRSHLTVGKRYRPVEFSILNKQVKVKNDKGDLYWYYPEHFKYKGKGIYDDFAK